MTAATPDTEPSCAGLTRGFVMKIKHRFFPVDCRVKPGNDEADASEFMTAGMRL
jgi:hypothetical protein